MTFKSIEKSEVKYVNYTKFLLKVNKSLEQTKSDLKVIMLFEAHFSKIRVHCLIRPYYDDFSGQLLAVQF